MLSSPNRPPINPAEIVVAIICVQGSEPGIRSILARLCHSGWEKTGKIGIISIPANVSRIPSRIQRYINLFLPEQKFIHVFVQEDVIIENRNFTGTGNRYFRYLPRLRGADRMLRETLEPLGLDWLSVATRNIEGWLHGKVDLQHTKNWLEQFSRLGMGWVGEGLLKTLDFWSFDYLRESFGLSLQSLQKYTHICVNRIRAGKSSDILANLLRKQISLFAPELPILDFRELLNDKAILSQSPKILFLEDGLFTGTELTNFLSGLLGLEHPRGRKWSTEKLATPQNLYDPRITLQFAVTTSLGVGLSRLFFKTQGLENVSIVENNGRAHIDNLTTAGKEALVNNQLFLEGAHKILADPSEHFKKMCFSDLRVWKDEERSKRAMAFCESIGVQLFEHYLRWKEWEWEPNRKRQCGLGMYGAGLAFAFGHSVPKASLPLLWMDGEVKSGNHTLIWNPLFPNAKA